MVAGKGFRWVSFALLTLLATGVVAAFQVRTPLPAFIVLGGLNATAKSSLGAVPQGWELKVNAGQPDITISDEAALHFKSVKSSYALERAVDVDPAKLPYLSWRWKVAQLPKGGDFRNNSTDDQAAQVMVAFTDRRVITYIWDSSAPQGTMQSASSIPLVHIFAVVCRSGAADLNHWLLETRDLAADYEKAFGRPAPHVKGLRLQINSQHTGSTAESFFGDVEFLNSRS
jgi:hypothetical protein